MLTAKGAQCLVVILCCFGQDNVGNDESSGTSCVEEFYKDIHCTLVIKSENTNLWKFQEKYIVFVMINNAGRDYVTAKNGVKMYSKYDLWTKKDVKI